MLQLSRPLLDDYAYVARRMRADERAQWCAFTGAAEYDPEVAAHAYAMTPGATWCLLKDTFPLAIGGFEPIRPGVFAAWMIGTDEAWTHWHAISRRCRKEMDALLANGAHRIEIQALHTRTKAGGWYMAALRMRFEGLLSCACANGQDAVIYARTKVTP